MHLSISTPSVAEGLARMQRGKTFRVTPKRNVWLSWWAMGDLRGDLADNKFFRRQLPAREPVDMFFVTEQLNDPVDLTDVDPS